MKTSHISKLLSAGLLVTPIAGAFLAAAPVHAAEPGLTVTITAIDAEASEDGDPALFVATREGGSIAQPLTVALKLSGSATPGADYVNPGATITFPAETSTVWVNITPLADAVAEGVETVTVELAPAPNAYTLGTAKSATATIADASGAAGGNTSQAGKSGPPRRVNPGSQGLPAPMTPARDR